MSKAPAPTPEEVVAAKRYTLMNLMRIGAVISVILGIAVARGTVELPYVLGVALAVAGLLAFFFGPPLLVRRWKAGDRGEL